MEIFAQAFEFTLQVLAASRLWRVAVMCRGRRSLAAKSLIFPFVQRVSAHAQLLGYLARRFRRGTQVNHRRALLPLRPRPPGKAFDPYKWNPAQLAAAWHRFGTGTISGVHLKESRQEAQSSASGAHRGAVDPIGKRDIKSDLRMGATPAKAIKASRTTKACTNRLYVRLQPVQALTSQNPCFSGDVRVSVSPTYWNRTKQNFWELRSDQRERI